MAKLHCRERTSPRSEARAFFDEQRVRSPVGPILFSMAVLNVASVILTLVAY